MYSICRHIWTMLQNYKSERKCRWLETLASQTKVKDIFYDRYGNKTNDIHKAVRVEWYVTKGFWENNSKTIIN